MLSKAERLALVRRVETVCPGLGPVMEQLARDVDEILMVQESRLRMLRSCLSPADEATDPGALSVPLNVSQRAFRLALARIITMAERDRA